MKGQIVKVLCLSAIALPLTGCVTGKEHKQVKAEREHYKMQAGTAHNDAIAARAQADAYKAQLDAYVASGYSKDSTIFNLSAQNNQLQRKLSDINSQYTGTMEQRGTFGAQLPANLVKELDTFAASTNGMAEFDKNLGLIKFNTDVVFTSGSADLTAQGKSVASNLAKILNNGSANGYEFMVAGHTDNQPVTKPATIAKGHKDNWHLSAHRAIAVGNELKSSGVGENRMAVVGYADQRPIADNSTADGRSSNRRVEVLILPTKAPPALVSKAPAKSADTSAKADTSSNWTASTDDVPYLNK